MLLLIVTDKHLQRFLLRGVCPQLQVKTEDVDWKLDRLVHTVGWCHSLQTCRRCCLCSSKIHPKWRFLYELLHGNIPIPWLSTIFDSPSISLNLASFSLVFLLQFHGGTNFGNTAGLFITTSYDYDAPVDEYGLPREPKYTHLKLLHKAIKMCEPALVSADPTVTKLGDNQEVFLSPAICVDPYFHGL